MTTSPHSEPELYSSGEEVDDTSEVSSVRSFSSVPLSNGQVPLDALNRLREEFEEVPVRVVPVTESQIAQETARRIALDSAQNARERIHRGPSPGRGPSTMPKTLPSADTLQRRVQLATMLNMKRQEYRTKIDFKFKRSYTHDMKIEFLEGENMQVDAILNMRKTPQMLKNGILTLSKTLEAICANLGIPLLQGSHEDVKTQLEEGLIDEDLEQLKIELAAWFALPPRERIMLKLGGIYANNLLENINIHILIPNSISQPTQGKSTQAPAADARLVRKGRDL